MIPAKMMTAMFKTSKWSKSRSIRTTMRKSETVTWPFYIWNAMQIYPVRKFRMHFEERFATLTSRLRFEFLARVVPICLPLNSERRDANLENTNLFVAGWGRTTEGGKPSDVLQQVQLPVLNNEICKDRYRKQGKLIDEQKQFNDAVMCVGYLEGGKDSCQGDSGM